jgi:hypothetical protein
LQFHSEASKKPLPNRQAPSDSARYGYAEAELAEVNV